MQSYEHHTSSINETQEKPVFRHQLTFKRKQHNQISYLRNVKHFLPFLTFTRVVFLGLIY